MRSGLEEREDTRLRVSDPRQRSRAVSSEAAPCCVGPNAFNFGGTLNRVGRAYGGCFRRRLTFSDAEGAMRFELAGQSAPLKARRSD